MGTMYKNNVVLIREPTFILFETYIFILEHVAFLGHQLAREKVVSKEKKLFSCRKPNGKVPFKMIMDLRTISWNHESPPSNGNWGIRLTMQHHKRLYTLIPLNLSGKLTCH